MADVAVKAIGGDTIMVIEAGGADYIVGLMRAESRARPAGRCCRR